MCKQTNDRHSSERSIWLSPSSTKFVSISLYADNVLVIAANIMFIISVFLHTLFTLDMPCESNQPKIKSLIDFSQGRWHLIRRQWQRNCEWALIMKQAKQTSVCKLVMKQYFCQLSHLIYVPQVFRTICSCFINGAHSVSLVVLGCI